MADKTCKICGADCAGLPRIKDPSGHYYHETCYEEARRHAAAREAEVAAAAEPEIDLLETPPMPQPSPMLEDDEPILEIAEAPAEDSVVCPACGQAVATHAVLCTSCGHNFQSGANVKATMVGVDRGREPFWPLVIGIISVVFGVCGIILHGFNATTSLMSGQIVAAIVAVLVGLLAVWLTAAGIGIARKQPSAVHSIRKWAMVKLAVYGLCMVASVGILTLASHTSDRIREEFDPDFPEQLVGNLIAVVIVLFGWFLLWPIFVLIWFGRAKVKTDIDLW